MKYPSRLFASVAALVMTNVAATATMALMADSATALPFSTRTSPTEREFEACADILMDLDMSVPTIAEACGAAQEPKALAKCIDGISSNTSITSDEALAGCVRVRRPEEMAKCVVSLDAEFDEALSSPVLGYCSRSLLPDVFENCVEGLYDPDTMDAMTLMASCVEVDYQAPQVFLPTFNPVSSGL